MLTEPVPELLEEIRWTGGEAIFDGRMFLHYFRTTADGRVLMGSGSGPIGFAGRVDSRFFADEATAARAEAGLRRLLPALGRALTLGSDDELTQLQLARRRVGLFHPSLCAALAEASCVLPSSPASSPRRRSAGLGSSLAPGVRCLEHWAFV